MTYGRVQIIDYFTNLLWNTINMDNQIYSTFWLSLPLLWLFAFKIKFYRNYDNFFCSKNYTNYDDNRLKQAKYVISFVAKCHIDEFSTIVWKKNYYLLTLQYYDFFAANAWTLCLVEVIKNSSYLRLRKIIIFEIAFILCSSFVTKNIPIYIAINWIVVHRMVSSQHMSVFKDTLIPLSI